MVGILYCKECGKILAVGGDGIEGEGVSHEVKSGDKTVRHEGYKKIIVDEEYDAKKYKTVDKWIGHLQKKYKDKMR
jgi:hypothetical protein